MYSCFLKKRIISLLPILCAFLFAPSVYSEEITVAAGGNPKENILMQIKGAFEKTTGINLAIVDLNAKAGISRSSMGSIDAIVTTYPLDEFIRQYAADDFKNADYRSSVVARYPLAVLVHSSNPVPQLSKEQLKLIFTGKIRNWKELGGDNIPLQVLINGHPPYYTAFSLLVLGGEAFPGTLAEDMKNSEEISTLVTASPGAVAFGPANLASGSIKQLKAPEIFAMATIVTLGPPTAKAVKLIDFIKGPGQKFLVW